MADKSALERIVDALNILADDPLGSEAPGLSQHPYERGARVLEAMVAQKQRGVPLKYRLSPEAYAAKLDEDVEDVAPAPSLASQASAPVDTSK